MRCCWCMFDGIGWEHCWSLWVLSWNGGIDGIIGKSIGGSVDEHISGGIDGCIGGSVEVHWLVLVFIMNIVTMVWK